MIRWKRIFHYRPGDTELNEELQTHLRMGIAERVERGESPEKARKAVLREFGNLLLVEEVTREQWGSRSLEAFGRDFRYALRQLRRHPAFAMTAVVMLALGIGANTAVFTVFQQVVLQNLPASHPHRLVLLSQDSASHEGSWSTWGDEKLYFSYPAYVALRDGNRTLDGLAASAFSPVNLATKESAEKGIAEYVTGNYFGVLGIRPVLGRLIEPADDRLHAGNSIAVLSDSYWQSQFGGDPSILDRIIRINGQTFTIVGVVRYHGLTNEYVPSLFVPISMQNAVMAGRDGDRDRLTDPLFYWITLIGRLKSETTQETAEQELNSIWLDWHRSQIPLLHHGAKFQKEWLQTKLSLRDGSRGLRFLENSLGDPLRVLFWMVGIVLAIACGNVANLLLIKASSRRRELAVRHALGAGQWQLCRQALMEGLLLGVLGSAGGLFFGTIALRVILGMIPQTNVLKTALSQHLDWRVLVFAMSLGLATSIVFSLSPALASMRTDPLLALHSASRAVMDRGSSLHGFLVACEIALSLVLLVSAGCVALTLYRLRTVNLGFTTGHCVTFMVDASALGKQIPQVRNEYESIDSALRRIPGVRSVSYSAMDLLSGEENGGDITVQGFAESGPPVFPDRDWITPNFLPTLQIPLLAGRNFSAQDSETSQKVAIVDEAFVRHYFGGNIQAALDGQMAQGGNNPKPDIQIVGVVPSIHAISLSHDADGPMIYLPYAQSWNNHRSHPASFYIRSAANPNQLAVAIRAAVLQVDKDLPIIGLGTMQEKVDDSIFQQRLMAMLACIMAGLALLMSTVGLYGVLSYAVAQRTREIGIRIALGASRKSVSLLIFRRLFLLVGGGLLAGVPLTWMSTRILASIAKLTGNTGWLFPASGMLMLLVCGLAGLLPTRRAASVDPTQALRAE